MAMRLPGTISDTPVSVTASDNGVVDDASEPFSYPLVVLSLRQGLFAFMAPFGRHAGHYAHKQGDSLTNRWQVRCGRLQGLSGTGRVVPAETSNSVRDLT